MPTKLESLARDATIPLIDAMGTLLGTAFFVAPNLAVTAAHVVSSALTIAYIPEAQMAPCEP